MTGPGVSDAEVAAVIARVRQLNSVDRPTNGEIIDAIAGHAYGERLLTAIIREAAAELRKGEGWRDAVLDRLAVAAMDAPLDEPPYKTIARIIDWHVAVATDHRVNGGFVLVPVEPTKTMIYLGGGSVRCDACICKTPQRKTAETAARNAYVTMIAAAPAAAGGEGAVNEI